MLGRYTHERLPHHRSAFEELIIGPASSLPSSASWGLLPDRRKVRPAEHGLSELMVDLYRGSDDALAESQLFSWHWLVVSGRTTSATSAATARVRNRCKSSPKRIYRLSIW